MGVAVATVALDLIIVVTVVGSNILFFLLVLAINKKIGYTIFELWLYIVMIAPILLIIINIAFGSPVPNSIYLSIIVPCLIYIYIVGNQKSKLNSAKANANKYRAIEEFKKTLTLK